MQDGSLTRAIAALVMVNAVGLIDGCGGGDPRAPDRSHVTASVTQLPGGVEQSSAVASSDAVIRYQAVDAVGAAEGEEAIVVLQHALLDPEHDIRDAAIDALADIGSDEAVAALAYALNDEDALLREAAIHALGLIGGPAATAALWVGLADTDDRVRRSADEMLAELTGATFAQRGSRE